MCAHMAQVFTVEKAGQIVALPKRCRIGGPKKNLSAFFTRDTLRGGNYERISTIFIMMELQCREHSESSYSFHATYKMY